jgi:hypothetical protein
LPEVAEEAALQIVRAHCVQQELDGQDEAKRPIVKLDEGTVLRDQVRAIQDKTPYLKDRHVADLDFLEMPALAASAVGLLATPHVRIELLKILFSGPALPRATDRLAHFFGVVLTLNPYVTRVREDKTPSPSPDTLLWRETFSHDTCRALARAVLTLPTPMFSDGTWIAAAEAPFTPSHRLAMLLLALPMQGVAGAGVGQTLRAAKESLVPKGPLPAKKKK